MLVYHRLILVYHRLMLVYHRLTPRGGIELPVSPPQLGLLATRSGDVTQPWHHIERKSSAPICLNDTEYPILIMDFVMKLATEFSERGVSERGV
jgi:hypothetical protein